MGNWGNSKKNIFLEIVGECGPKYEELDRFSESLFKDVYYKAFRMTEHVIERSRTHERGHFERLYNIISFMGERGTGKTSAVNSFTEALKEFDERKYQEFMKSYTGSQKTEAEETNCFKNTEFVVLENIDASLLENKEDIFEVVLAKMLEKIVESVRRNNDYAREKLHFQNTKLLREFESICKNKKDMDSKSDTSYREGISSVELLRNLSGSMDLRENFSKLVPQFLDAVLSNSDKREYKSTQSFLVLTIDDLDLNKERGFDMLEQIHRYFMVPRVLIYLAVSESQLMDICEKHFEGVYGNSDRLARAYADKVLPGSQRIYMPVLLSRKNNIFVEKKVLGEDRAEDPNDYDMKQTIFWKIGHRTFVYFDSRGLKTHFYEPENIRDLTNLYQIIQSMEKLDLDRCKTYPQTGSNPEEKILEENSSLLQTCEINWNTLLDDIYNRLANSRLNREQRNFFQELYKEDVSRQGERFLHYIGEKEKEQPYFEESRKQGYNFGEVLRGIYHMGRENEEEKPLIHCFLAVESVMLTRLYIRSLYDWKKESRNRARTALLDSLGGSVAGSWGNYLLPPLLANLDTEEGDYYGMGFMKLNSRAGGNILSLENLKAQSLNEFLDELKKYLMPLELLLMCITSWSGQYKSETDCIIKIERSGRNEDNPADKKDIFSQTDNKNAVRIRYENQSVTFDAWGFVINSARYAEYFNSIHEAIFKGIKECFEVNDDKNEEIEKIKNTIASNSILNEYENWEAEYGYAALPFYNVDMFYNLEKRVRRECKKKYPQGMGIEKDSIFNVMLEAYQSMGRLLKEQDEFYKDEDEFSNWKSLEKAYNECPYIKHMMGNTADRAEDDKMSRTQEEKQLRQRLKRVFNDFVYDKAIYNNNKRITGDERPSEIGDY